MNSLMQEQGPVLEQTQALRNQLMEILADEDLAYSPGGDNPTLGGLCREMAEVQQSYIISFQTFEQNFDYRIEDPGLETSVAQLSGRFQAMDHELKAALETLSEEDIQKRLIDRGGGFVLPVAVQFHIYREALLIFYAKTSVYLKALGKTLPEQWRTWIA
ncbi:MAG: DinB family protein [Anaerolineae bacterium]